MTEKRYINIYTLPENLYVPQLPVIIKEGTLIYDMESDQAFIQLKMMNVVNHSLDSVKVMIQTKDENGINNDQPILYTYENLNVYRNQEFGSREKIAVREIYTTKIFRMTVLEVRFSDGTVYKNTAHDLHPIVFEDGKYEDLWVCSCGHINHEEENECFVCRKDTSEKHEEMNARKKIEIPHKIQKNKKKIIFGGGIFCIALVLAIFIKAVIFPSSKNKQSSILMKLKMSEVGDVITFGHYEQDNDFSNGKEEIEWIVLDKAEDKILVISKAGLDSQRYNQEWVETAWETCDLRKWLNNTFMNEAFSEEEKSTIATVTVTADRNPNYDTYQGINTQDQVFLLSIDEADRYFSSDESRMCVPSEYAVARGVETYTNSNIVEGKGICCWWLRSCGNDRGSASIVNNDGYVNADGDYVNYHLNAVRPALWITFDYSLNDDEGGINKENVKVEEIPIDSEIVNTAMDIGFNYGDNCVGVSREKDIEELCWATYTTFDYYFINDKVLAEELPDNVKISIAWNRMEDQFDVSEEKMEEMVKMIFGSSTKIIHQRGLIYNGPSYYDRKYNQPGFGGDGLFTFKPHYVFSREKAELIGDKLNVYYRVGWIDSWDGIEISLYKKDRVTELGEIGTIERRVVSEGYDYIMYDYMSISRDKLIEYMKQGSLYKFEFIKEGDHYCFVSSQRID